MSDRNSVKDCDYPWTGFMPFSDGNVNCCCYGSAPIGNLNKGTPEQIWNGPTIQSLRASLAAGVVHSVCRTAACKFVLGSRANPEPTAHEPVSLEGFDEEWYVAHYHDVDVGLVWGRWKSGAEHYRTLGHREFRARNARDWQASQERVTHETLERPELARLSWEGEPRVEGARIRLEFRALNSGGWPWETNLVHAGAWLTPRMQSAEPFLQVAQSSLGAPVRSGESASFSLEFPVTGALGERSFAVVDLFSRTSGRRFSETLTRPLILALSRSANGELRFWATKVPEPRPLRADRTEELI